MILVTDLCFTPTLLNQVQHILLSSFIEQEQTIFKSSSPSHFKFSSTCRSILHFVCHLGFVSQRFFKSTFSSVQLFLNRSELNVDSINLAHRVCNFFGSHPNHLSLPITSEHYLSQFPFSFSQVSSITTSFPNFSFLDSGSSNFCCNLKRLIIRNCYLTQSSTFSLSCGLQSSNMKDDDFKLILTSLSLSSVRYLDLSYSSLSDAIVNHLVDHVNKTNLLSLNLSNNPNITCFHQIKTALVSNSSLLYLNLNDCNLDSASVLSIVDGSVHSSLVVLDLTGYLPSLSELIDLGQLLTISKSRVKVNVLPFEIDPILKILRFNGQISKQDVSTFLNFISTSSFKIVDISNSDVTNISDVISIASTFVNSNCEFNWNRVLLEGGNVIAMDLSGLQLTIVDQLTYFTDLEILNLSNIRYSDPAFISFITSLYHLPNLSIVNLSSMSLGPRACEAIGLLILNQKSLRDLTVSYCDFESTTSFAHVIEFIECSNSLSHC
ncbi:hypothetical protein GEMRC1_003941 [Eukaryota sp. GEM-RC1]